MRCYKIVKRKSSAEMSVGLDVNFYVTGPVQMELVEDL